MLAMAGVVEAQVLTQCTWCLHCELREISAKRGKGCYHVSEKNPPSPESPKCFDLLKLNFFQNFFSRG